MLTNPRDKIAFEKPPEPTNLRCGDQPGLRVRPNGIGMNIEQRRRLVDVEHTLRGARIFECV
ncbi:hypothetical protein AOA14_18515 [Sphingopyxis terrae subsp. terrae NBRC 15098]|uniref:Uncharacterized protein n=1 Tax=Sphingopyxis terrae subsp. terrae NBRC 15098 TaxID=1219058 RepID=A0A142W4Z3_9SPHN|nr:hypothetical protein AOA14_18515 [Sphingopyxis terrae subsp. terrae NBRC 15098]